MTLPCTTSNHLISTGLNSTKKLLTVLSVDDIEKMVEKFRSDGGIDEVIEFLQDTSNAATTTDGTNMDKFISFTINCATAYKNKFHLNSAIKEEGNTLAGSFYLTLVHPSDQAICAYYFVQDFEYLIAGISKENEHLKWRKWNCDHGMKPEAMEYYDVLLEMFTQLQNKIPELDELFNLWFHQHGKKPKHKLMIGKRSVSLPPPKKRPRLSELFGLK